MAQARVRRSTKLLVAAFALGAGACAGGSNAPTLTVTSPDVAAASVAAQATASPILPGPAVAFEAKLEGHEFVAPEEPAAAAPAVDLMAALRASVEAAKKRKGEAEPSPAQKREQAKPARARRKTPAGVS